MSTLSLDGVELYYELHGEGPLVVFIHGASGTHLSWWQQIAEFRYHFSCLIYDQRGFGRSRATKPYDVGDGDILYDDLRQLIEHVAGESETVSIVGASLGTAPALHYAMENASQIDKLLMVCGPGGATSDSIAARWDERYRRMRNRHSQLEAHTSPTNAPGLYAKVPPVRSPGEFERFAVAYHPFGPVGEAMHLDSPALTFLYAEIMALAGGPPTIELLPCFHARPVTAENAAAVDFPVLVVGGTEDALFGPEELEEVASLFPTGRAKLFKGSGHAAYFERARRFNDVALEFLTHGHAD